MDSSVSPRDKIWFLRVCHHISNAVYYHVARILAWNAAPYFLSCTGEYEITWKCNWKTWIHSVGVELLHTDGQAYKHDETSSRNFANVPTKYFDREVLWSIITCCLPRQVKRIKTDTSCTYKTKLHDIIQRKPHSSSWVTFRKVIFYRLNFGTVRCAHTAPRHTALPQLVIDCTIIDTYTTGLWMAARRLRKKNPLAQLI
jgi:hypothetical protein